MCLEVCCSTTYPDIQELKNTLETGKWHACYFGVEAFWERIAVSEVMASSGAEDALLSTVKRAVRSRKKVWAKRIGAQPFGEGSSRKAWLFCNKAIPDAALVLIERDDPDIDKEFHIAVDLGKTCGPAIEAMIEAQSLHQIIKFRGLASIENVAFFSEQQSAMGRFGLAKCMHDARGMKGFEVTLDAATDMGRLRFRTAGWTLSHAVMTATCDWIDR